MLQAGEISRRDVLIWAGGLALNLSGCGARRPKRSKVGEAFLSGVELSSSLLEREMSEEVPVAVKKVQDFFQEHKSGIAEFSGDVLSFEGKLAYAKGVYDPDSHDRFLEKSFARNLFSPEELRATIESAVGDFVQLLTQKETNLLEDQYQWIQNWAGQAPKIESIPMEFPQLVHQYDLELEGLNPVVAGDVGVELGKAVTSEIVQRVTTAIVANIASAIATRMGISSGVVGAGTAGSAVSFGASLIGAMMVDFALEWIIEQTGYSPEAEVARRVEQTLDRVCHLVVEGEFPPDLPPLYEADKDPHYEGVYRYDEPETPGGPRLMHIEKPWLVGPYNDAKIRESNERAARQKEADARLADGPGLRYQLIRFNRARTRIRDAALENMANSMT